MNAAEEIYHKETKKDVTPAGVFYYQLQDPIIKADHAEEEICLKISVCLEWRIVMEIF